jgi:hypothetical protein
MAHDASDRHGDDQDECGWAGCEANDEQAAAEEFRGHRQARLKRWHGNSKFAEPRRKPVHRAGTDDSELSEGVNHEAEADRDSSEEQGEIDEQRIVSVEKRAEIHVQFLSFLGSPGLAQSQTASAW